MKLYFNGGRSKARIASILLVIFLLAVNTLTCLADVTTVKYVRTKDIAVVFDDSGSMYLNPTPTAWCRATYAIEVFAAMMNEKDRLRIYPMNGIETGGQTYTKDNPLSITTANVSSIREIFSPKAGDTHIEAVYEAYKDLKSETKYNDKWLIVITDGAEFYEEGKPLGSKTKEKLTEVLGEYSKDVNVMYLGIGKQSAMPDVTGNSKYVFDVELAADSTSVLEKLSTMCNSIFGRDALSVQGDKIEFDIPMKKLLVFIQGTDIGDISLEGFSARPTAVYSPHYGERGSGNYSVVVDKTLQGCLATFEDVPSGSYTIKYNGSKTSMNVFYEPDVTLKCELYNADGEKLESADTAYPGTYRLEFGLAAKTNSGTYEYTESKLLGNISYKLTVFRNGEAADPLMSDKPGVLEIAALKEGDNLDAEIQANYLKNYQVTLRGSEIGWPENGWAILKQRDYFLDISLFISQNYYQISRINDGDPIVINVLLNNTKLNQEQMEALITEVNFDGIDTKIEPDYKNSAFNVWLQKGDYKDGKYTFKATVSGTDFDHNAVSDTETATFTISRVPSWLKWAILGALLIILTIIAIIVLHLPALPRTVRAGKASAFLVEGEKVGVPHIKANKNGTKMNLVVSTPVDDGAQLNASIATKTLSQVKDFGGESKMLQVTDVSNVSQNIRSIKIGASQFKQNDSGKWVLAQGKQMPNIGHGTMIVLEGESESFNGIPRSMSARVKTDFTKQKI